MLRVLGSRGWVTAVAMAVVVASCGDSPTAAPEPGAPVTAPSVTEPVTEPSGESTERSTVPTPSTDRVADTDPPEGDAVVSSCTWRWFDRYDIEVVLPEDVEAGTSFDVEALVYADDSASFGAVGSFVADGGGPHMVEATVERPSWIDPDELESDGEFAPHPGSMCEFVVRSGSVALDGYAELQWAPDPPESDGSELGDLVASETSVDAPMLALAELLWMQPQPAFDTIYIAPTSDLSSMSVERDGTCREIRSVYIGSDAQFVFVTQRWGCPERPETTEGDTVIETVADEPWRVQVQGSSDGVASLISDLRSIEIPGGEGVDGPSEPTADAWIDGYIETNDGVTELARYEWRSGKIAIVRREAGGELSPYGNPVVFGLDANLPSSVVGCAEYTVGIASSLSGSTGGEPRGYAWFVARDEGTRFVFSTPGLPEMVPLEHAPSGEFVGFVDLGATPASTTAVSVVDAGGDTVPCTQ